MSALPPEEMFFKILEYAAGYIIKPLLLRLASRNIIPSVIFTESNIDSGLQTVKKMDRKDIVKKFLEQIHVWNNILPCSLSGSKRMDNMIWIKNNCHILLVGIPDWLSSEVSTHMSKLTIGEDIDETVITGLIKCSKGFIKRSVDFVESNGRKLGEVVNSSPMGYDKYEKYTSQPYSININDKKTIIVDVGYWRKAVDIE